MKVCDLEFETKDVFIFGFEASNWLRGHIPIKREIFVTHIGTSGYYDILFCL